MRRILLAGILALGCQWVAEAQTPLRPFEKIGTFETDRNPLFPARALVNPRGVKGTAPVDILHYDLDLHLSMVSEHLRGRATITILMNAPGDSVVLNGVQLQIDSVLVDGVRSTIGPDTVHESFAVRLGRIRAAGDTVRVVLSYERPPALKRPSSRRGYYFFLDTLGIPSNLGYTMSEPSDARFWFPCVDEPWEKATSAMHITVPQGYVPASNGSLTSVIDNGDGTMTWHWKENHQIAPYLMCATVSRFSVSTLSFVRTLGDTIPLQYYTWHADSTQAAAYLPTVRQMVKVLSRVYGPYPFEKYGMSAIVPFAYGGMEHQTITTLNRFYITDDRVVVHELAHQWWGDLVTCGSWADVWLNESFATYTEALWQESLGGPIALKDYMAGLMHLFYGSWQGAIYDPVSQGFNLFDDVVYSKGAWVLHTLRGVVGDSTYFRILSAYRQRHAERAAVTDDLAAVVDSVTGTDMRWFFSQWVYGKGWPRLQASYTWSADSLLHLLIQQTQDPQWPLFRLPLVLRAYRAGAGTTDFSIVDSLRTESFTFPMTSAPDSVVLDPDGWVLKETGGNAGPVGGGGSIVLVQNFPNPFSSTTTFGYGIPIPSAVTLTVYDILGRRVATLVDQTQVPGFYQISFDASSWASGVYFYHLQSDPGSAGSRMTSTGKMIVIH
jgi:aminopeptidase N